MLQLDAGEKEVILLQSIPDKKTSLFTNSTPALISGSERLMLPEKGSGLGMTKLVGILTIGILMSQMEKSVDNCIIIVKMGHGMILNAIS